MRRNTPLPLASLALLLAMGSSVARADDLRFNQGTRASKKLLIFVVRSEGVDTKQAVFEDEARKVLDQHFNAQIVTQSEALAQGGAEFQRKLFECRGTDACYAKLASSIDANLLLVIAATYVGGVAILGSRLLDLEAVKVMGNAIDAVPDGSTFIDALAERIRGSVPPDLWDPFGTLQITSEPGAEILINNRAIGLDPLPRLTSVPEGVYVVAASKSGYVRAEKSIEVHRGENALLAVPLQPEPVTWYWWAAGGVVVAAGAAAVLGLVFSSRETTFCSSPDPMACKP